MAKLPSRGLAMLALLLASALCQASERIVVLTSDVADIVVALGAAPQVVGRDRSSRHPALAHAREIGFARALNAEPIVPLKPTLVLGSEQAQPPGIWKQLDTLGIPARQVASHEDGRDFAQAIVRIGQWLGRDADARQLARRWQDGMATRPASGKRYLISYDGRMVAGRGTAADTLIRAAGGINAAGQVDGIKPLNREAWQQARPDVVIVASHNRAVYGSVDALKARPELAGSPAVRQGKVVEMRAHQVFMITLDSPEIIRQLQAL